MKKHAFERIVLAMCAVVLAAVFAVGARWPLVGDSVLMHYVVLLTQHGFAPYKDVAEMNLPLTYISEQAAMWVFGAGDVGWRLYDGTLVLATVALSWRLLRTRGAVAGLFAATLFATVHLQDGIHMAGQRDLLVTVLQAISGCALLRACREPARNDKAQANWWPALLFAACSVAAGCVKPPALLFALLAAAWLVAPEMRRRNAAVNGSVLLPLLAGGVVPLLLCLLYLWHFGAVSAFLHDVQGLIAYHASLERRSIGFLLGHVWSPVLAFLLLTIATTGFRSRWRRDNWTHVDSLCGMGAVAGLVSYLVQGKGFPYQRYPFLLWVLLLCTSRLFAALRARDGANRSGRAAGLQRLPMQLALFTGVALMLVFVVRASHFSKADPYGPLRRDLRTQNAAAQNGRVQCLDTAGTCIGAFYKDGLVQSTGFLYDCYLLDGANPVVQEQRRLFEREFLAQPPELVVLTDSHCFTGARTFDKYRDWPWMQERLAGYAIALERHPTEPMRLWSRPEMPYGYRILRRVHVRTADESTDDEKQP